MLDTSVRVERAVPYRTWILACAAAETVGMTASASAALLAAHTNAWPGLAVVIVGGLVEGLALGWAQARTLHKAIPAIRSRRYVAVTVAVAGLGWTAASAPAALSAHDSGQPALALMIGGALALGATMGALLGAAQASALRGAVRHPWRWVAASTVAWPPAMALIFLGASSPRETWPAWSVVLLGALTGTVAGTTLGAVSGLFLTSLDGPSVATRLVLAALASPHRSAVPTGLLGLELTGRVSGRRYRLPVQWALAPGGLAIAPGHPSRKTWWRNLGPVETPVRILRESVWAPAGARLVRHDDPAYDAVISAYRQRWPHAHLEDRQAMVLVRLGGPALDGSSDHESARAPHEE